MVNYSNMLRQLAVITEAFGYEVSTQEYINNKHSIELYWKDPEIENIKFLGLFDLHKNCVFIGTLWLNDASIGASKDNIVFSLCGLKYLPMIDESLKEIAKICNIKEYEISVVNENIVYKR